MESATVQVVILGLLHVRQAAVSGCFFPDRFPGGAVVVGINIAYIILDDDYRRLVVVTLVSLSRPLSLFTRVDDRPAGRRPYIGYLEYLRYL